MNITFWRNENYDNSLVKRKLPYEGKSWFVIKTCDKKRLIEFLKDYLDIEKCTLKDVDINNLKSTNIIALNYKQANDYVVGDSDIIPEAIQFNYKIHASKFILIDLITKMGYSIREVRQCERAPYYPKNVYQVITPYDFLHDEKFNIIKNNSKNKKI